MTKVKYLSDKVLLKLGALELQRRLNALCPTDTLIERSTKLATKKAILATLIKWDALIRWEILHKYISNGADCGLCLVFTCSSERPGCPLYIKHTDKDCQDRKEWNVTSRGWRDRSISWQIHVRASRDFFHWIIKRLKKAGYLEKDFSWRCPPIPKN